MKCRRKWYVVAIDEQRAQTGDVVSTLSPSVHDNKNSGATRIQRGKLLTHVAKFAGYFSSQSTIILFVRECAKVKGSVCFERVQESACFAKVWDRCRHCVRFVFDATVEGFVW